MIKKLLKGGRVEEVHLVKEELRIGRKHFDERKSERGNRQYGGSGRQFSGGRWRGERYRGEEEPGRFDGRRPGRGKEEESERRHSERSRSGHDDRKESGLKGGDWPELGDHWAHLSGSAGVPASAKKVL
jgi:hypothetical protein